MVEETSGGYPVFPGQNLIWLIFLLIILGVLCFFLFRPFPYGPVY